MESILVAVGILLAGGLAALFVPRQSVLAPRVGAFAAVFGCAVGLVPTLQVLSHNESLTLRHAWGPPYGSFAIGLDALSAFFLLPVLGLSAVAAIYGSEYLKAYADRKSLGPPSFFLNVFVTGMVMALVARTTLLFLIAWEVMSVAAYCLVTFEHEEASVRRAGWIYLIATHLGVVFLYMAFLLLGREAGGLEFADFHALAPRGVRGAGWIFLLTLVGFGAKAGLVPWHVWLPEAHPAAPSHVSALMSGVMIKMGLYGILRLLTFLGPPAPWWGPTLAGIGLVTALLGISLALHQRDLKRALAYSSIENVGLITLTLGVSLWGRAAGLPAVALLGATAGLFHVWNHALMKSLMFLAAGSVVGATGTKDIEQLGGLMSRMPQTGIALLAGAAAISALPPLNGFVSKWLLYLSLLQSALATGGSRSLIFLLAVGLVALVGGLAAMAFVRLVGVVLLGVPRSGAAERARESSPGMTVPLLALVAGCVVIALAPQLATGALAGTVETVCGAEVPRVPAPDTPLATLGLMNAVTFIAVAATALMLATLTRRTAAARHVTWDCGYAAPTARMQYTGRSLAEMLAERLLPRGVRPRVTKRAPRGLFPAESQFHAESPDPVSRRLYEPLFEGCAERFARLRVLQQGRVHVYLVYIRVAVVIALAWTSFRAWWWGAS
jgi:formate hydrogenlyase subunit 3/multisubunit Na+/H+ antiporter MnhD subunit